MTQNCRDESKSHVLIQQNSTDYTCKNCDTKISFFPKDCIVCDTCNKACSSPNFTATCDGFWYQDWYYCDDCHKKSHSKKEDLVLKVLKNDDLSNTDLAKPISFESW